MKVFPNYVVVSVALFALVLGVYVSNHYQSAEVSEHTQVYQKTRAIEPFELQDQNGKPFTNQQLTDKWSFVFLGYLSCPDICPMTIAKLSRLLPQLQQKTQHDVQVLFISVDPKRDSADKRKQYVEYFHQNIIGLGADHPQLYPFVRNLGLMYSVPDESVLSDYYVDHSASVVLINPLGKISAIFKPLVEHGAVPTVAPEIVLADFQTMLDHLTFK